MLYPKMQEKIMQLKETQFFKQVLLNIYFVYCFKYQ